MICCMCDLHVVRSFDIFPEISKFETSRVVSQWKVLVASNKYLFLLCFNFLLFDHPQLRIMRTLRVQNSLSQNLLFLLAGRMMRKSIQVSMNNRIALLGLCVFARLRLMDNQ